MLKKVERTNVEKITLKGGKERYHFKQRFSDTNLGTRYKEGTCDTLEEAEDLLSEVISKVRGGQIDVFLSDEGKNELLFENIAMEWLNMRRLEVDFEELTEESFQAIMIQMRRYILPSFYGKLVTDITTKDCSNAIQLWSRKKGDKQGYKKISALKSILNGVFQYTIIEKNNNFINPLNGLLRNPKRNKKQERNLRSIQVNDYKIDDGTPTGKLKYYQEDQLKEFFSSAAELKLPTKKYILLELLSLTGVRVGEALALSWKHVDFKEKTLLIEKTARNRNVFDRTKTLDSNRKISLTLQMIEDLKKWKSIAQDKFLENDINFSENSLIFPYMKGQWDHPENNGYVSKIIKDVCKFNGTLPRITPHGFRHTYITLQLMRGVSLQWVSKTVGHRNVQVTARYTHELDSAQKEVANSVNKWQEEFGIKLSNNILSEGAD